MESFMARVALISFALILTSCAGGPHGAGYWFHFIFIIIPMFVIGFLLLKKGSAIANSLSTIEGQIERLSSKLDDLEEEIRKLTDKNHEEKPK